MNKIKSTKGITLISLMVTIVVLLINTCRSNGKSATR